VGPNGCGKSTIIRALSHVISTQRGRMLLDGKDIASISRQELARMLGVVPQMPLLPSAFTAFEVVLMGRNPHLGLFQYEGRKELDIAWHAMEKTMTQHLAQRRVGELSGGEIQSILIARVLAQETKAILLDEPTANLDPHGVKRFREFITEQRARGKTIIFSTHLLTEAEQLADRVGIFVNSRLVAQESIGGLRETFLANGTIEDMYLHYVGSYEHEHH
ncbi:MAG TPA: ABC transporter ATP-binding protein, partial [Bacteroidetes bacterium]|nr:ABC transporter ATP-binding protein [Bacteroidota bacterium]